MSDQTRGPIVDRMYRMKDAAGAAAGSVFQSPADVVFPGSTAAAADVERRAREAYESGKSVVKDKMRATGRELGAGAIEGAKPAMSTLAKVLLGLLGIAVVGGVVWAVTNYKSGDKSAE